MYVLRFPTYPRPTVRLLSSRTPGGLLGARGGCPSSNHSPESPVQPMWTGGGRRPPSSSSSSSWSSSSSSSSSSS
eukprot:2141909-Pyramimonas_sp.AAC.1